MSSKRNIPCELTVSQVVQETADAISIWFDVPEGHWETFSYDPGQFLTLRIPGVDEGSSVARCYSLSSSPHAEDTLAVTVKRTADGYASNWLCDHAVPGMKMTVLPPSGHFTAKDLDADMILFAAGSGITPIISIIKSSLLEGGGHLILFYANQNAESAIFYEELRHLANQFPERFSLIEWLEIRQGLPDRQTVADLCAEHRNRAFFLCGPAKFMDLVTDAAHHADVPHRNLHREVFQSLRTDPFDVDNTVSESMTTERAHLVVYLDGERAELDWPKDISLVDILLKEGFSPPYSCREGGCGACLCRVVDGDVEMKVNDVLVEDDIEEGDRLACQSVPVTDSVTVTFD
ncbi:2Fe-2S iron-sulfur cluster-binding protein [Nocardia sp. NPDC003482]|jgi:3-ketosteroid 9alpha-monooxygenase subunit B|uniref:3-ketosteroid-9-alpha-hydroxylase reductase subunit n=2 Tax=Nocardia TaxID=1817 RepID=A0A231GVI6_9NOCA|nr:MULTISPECIES: ferredoxin--NADP reductase [Nocardia]OXR40624.1 3-ketosteroid-9-alpha-hydroxylase reductase subunit [Nocardia cerradoensis]